MRGSVLITLAALVTTGCAPAPATSGSAGSDAEASRTCTTNWYADADGDGYGSKRVVKRSCIQPVGYVSNAADCDDRRSTRHPGATEYCDGKDQDCDATADDDAVDAGLWYADVDGDGFGDAGSDPIGACTPPEGYVADRSDCSDDDAKAFPGAFETCDTVDNDCDAGVDEGEVCAGPNVEMKGSEICGDGTDQEGDGAGCEPRGVLEVTSADESWTAAAVGAGVGWDVEYAGDVDGDGRSDWLAGGPGFWSEGFGETRLVYGDASGSSVASAVFEGASAGDYAGYASAPAGDVDNDGFDDILLTAPGYDAPYEDAGAAFLVYGGPSRRSGSTSVASVGARFIGGAEGELAGASVMSLGHFDGDAYADFAIGSTGADVLGVSDAGAVYIYAGQAADYTGEHLLSATATAMVHGTTTWTAMADQNAIASADLDADGMDDMLVGAWDFSGARLGADAFLFYGEAGGLSGNVEVTAADAQFHGTVGWWSYIEIGDAGDVNADGYEDFLIGLPDQQADEMGSAYLFYGGATRRAGTIDDAAADAIFQGSSDSDYELTVSGGDIDGDSYSDVVVGSPWNSTSATDGGAVYVWYGGEMTGTYAASAADARYYGTTEEGYLGSDVAAGGDVDADGYADLVMGAYGEGAYDGSAWLVLGGGL